MKIKYFSSRLWIFILLIHAFSYGFFMLLPISQASGQEIRAKVSSPAYDLTLKGLLSHTVREVGVKDIKSLDSYQILDSRELKEFQVSHIPGGKWVGYDDFNMERIEKLGLDKNKPVLLYCSVGYRSEKIGEKLKAAGFKEVCNLYGGIFEWVNEGKPLVDGQGKPTEKVHAYDKLWGSWVKKGEKVYEK
ncbi:MAG: rhodanese-like domain-containing protein [Bacteroidia bacterium]|nr:rhodanese-like domain-containing protein [Bacteroidia bacterium]